MKQIISCIEDLRKQLGRMAKEDLKELPTRTILIDPMLMALGWDVRNPDDVQLEYPTIDGKSVDYAAKINREKVLFIEAKPMKDPLTDVKAITQVVGYAANDGVEWCVLTNGVIYKVYRTTEKAEAPKKLLYEVSIDSKDSRLEEIAEKLNRLSKTSMEAGMLDEMGEEIFTLGKVRASLDKLFEDPPEKLVRIVRSELKDETVKPNQIKNALTKLWDRTPVLDVMQVNKGASIPDTSSKNKRVYDESYHTANLPVEVIELYRTLDTYCRGLDPSNIHKNAAKLYLNFIHGKKSIFCCVVFFNTGLHIYLKLDYSELKNPLSNMRDVSNIGHWGVGNVEITIDNWDKLQSAKPVILQSFEKNKERNL